MKRHALHAAVALTVTLGGFSIGAPSTYATPSAEQAVTPAPSSQDEDPAVSAAKEKLDCTTGERDVVVDADGAKHVIQCITLGPATPSSREAIRGFGPDVRSHEHSPTGHWSPYQDEYIRCGSSYARNQQIAWYRYRGTVHASGEYASGGGCGDESGRVVAASITYMRDGRVLAKARAGIGETKHTGAWDHHGYNHEVTQVYHDFTFN